MKKEKDYESQYDFEIDYDLFNTDEIVKIFNFFGLILKNAKRPVNKDLLLKEYNEYRRILNNKTLEKQYDKNFEKKTGISIYKTISKIN
jgi:uncharacterized protein YktA (UPF0223 family)